MFIFVGAMGNNQYRENIFRFKQFSVKNDRSAMKVGTDGVLLGAWCSIVPGFSRILDVGAGTGLISLMLAQRCQQASITGIEIDSDASTEAEFNFMMSPWSDRLALISQDFKEFAAEYHSEPFDLIVSNPPYFVDSLQAPDMSRSAARHTVTLSCDDILGASSRLLSPEGAVALITPYELKESLIYSAIVNKLELRRITNLFTSVKRQNPKRILWEFVRKADRLEETSLYIGSDDYMKLVEPFYLDKI